MVRPHSTDIITTQSSKVAINLQCVALVIVQLRDVPLYRTFWSLVEVI